MDNPLDKTTLATIALLESRLQRIEHVLHGTSASIPAKAEQESAIQRMADLDKRFGLLVSRIRVYSELMRIYRTNPDFFHSADPSQPPSQLAPDAIRSIVLASASSFPSTLSALTAIKDCSIPDPTDSAALIGLTERMKVIEATQLAQAAQVAQLRGRSEAALRAWFEGDMLQKSNFVADAESRVERAERTIRQKERAIERAQEI